MQISYLPAVGIAFTPKDGGEKVMIFRPYSAFSPEELSKHADEDSDRGALSELAERYYFGLGVPKDYEKAYTYALRAAGMDVPDAMFLLAECYREGHFVEQDYEKYFDWVSRAAEHGSWMAMFNLSAAYREGPKAYGGAGPAIDHTQSFAWSMEAERTIRAYWDYYNRPNFTDFGEIKLRLLNAYSRVCRQISAHYSAGMGVRRDLNRALAWLERGKRFYQNATGKMETPEFDKDIEQMKARIHKDEARGTKRS